MRIVWFSHRDIEHPRAGGAERTAFEVSRRFARFGDEVQLVTAGWPGAATTARLEGFSIRRFPTALGPHIALPVILRGSPPPDVVVDDLAHVVPWGSPWFSRFPGVVMFRHLHARTLPGQVGPTASALLAKVERGYPLIYKSWPFITETSGSIADLIRLGIPEIRCHLIRPGVDLDVFRAGTRSPIPLLVYFGGLRAYKRADHAIRALVRVKSGLDSPCRLAMVGDGPSLESLKSLASALGVRDSVTFTGRISQSRLAHVLSESWINLHCSVAEGWGYSTLEAAAAGVPTVGYKVAGLAESVADGASGRLVEDGNVEKLADAVIELLADLQGWSRSARRYAEGFSWDSTATEWRRVLNGIAGISGS